VWNGNDGSIAADKKLNSPEHTRATRPPPMRLRVLRDACDASLARACALSDRLLPPSIVPLSAHYVGWRALHGCAVLYVVLAVPCRFAFEGGDGAVGGAGDGAGVGAGVAAAEGRVGSGECDADSAVCLAGAALMLLLQRLLSLLLSLLQSLLPSTTAALLPDLLCDVAFAADAVIGARTSYIDDASQVLVTDRAAMRSAYLDEWLLTDVLSAALPLPLDLAKRPLLWLLRVSSSPALGGGGGVGGGGRWLCGALLCHGPAVLRLARLPKLFAYLGEAETFFLCSSSRRKLLQLLRLGFSMFLLMHLTGCAWFVMGRLEGWPEGNGWLPPPRLRAATSTVTATASAAATATTTAPFRTRYLHACYWGFVAMTGLGPGVAMPETDAEVAFMMVRAAAAAAAAATAHDLL